MEERDLLGALEGWIYAENHPWIQDALADEAELAEMMTRWNEDDVDESIDGAA